MNTTDYEYKIAEFLKDRTKFTKIKKDPSNDLKSEMNELITAANSDVDCNVPKITGHHESGYIYVNPKTHKTTDDPPLRPIISQVGTVTYSTA